MRKVSCLGGTDHHGPSEYHPLITGVDPLIHGDKVHVRISLKRARLWADFLKGLL